MKLNPMPDHVKSLRLAVGNIQLIPSVVRHIFNPAASQTNEMMVCGHIPVKTRHVMTHVDFPH